MKMVNHSELIYEGWFRFNGNNIKFCKCFLIELIELHNSIGTYEFSMESVDGKFKQILKIKSSSLPSMQELLLYNSNKEILSQNLMA